MAQPVGSIRIVSLLSDCAIKKHNPQIVESVIAIPKTEKKSKDLDT